jgi:hypothetical protein
MIRFIFNIRNPFQVNDKERVDYIEYSRNLTKNKHLEVQLSKLTPTNVFGISLDTIWYGQDHGGFNFNIELLGYYFEIHIYDIRHWDFENGCWEIYEEHGDE